jgi:hypothetical protein
MDGPIADDECLAIYVLDSDKLRRDGAHWRAFLPNPEDGERSLFRVSGLGIESKAEIGQTHIGDPKGRPLRAWAELIANQIRQYPPLAVIEAEPPDRHGVIKDWPAEPQQVRALAMALADVASTQRWPPT